MGAAEAVMVPMLSRIQNEPERYRATFLQFYEAAALGSCLLTGVMLALARPITLTVLGGHWEEATLVFAGFTVSAICAPLAAVSSWLFVSQGRGQRHAVLELARVGPVRALRGSRPPLWSCRRRLRQFRDRALD